MIGYVVAGIKHKSMCCCMDDPWDYVLLQAFFMGLCVVGIIHGIVYCCRDYAWEYVLLPGWLLHGLHTRLCFVTGIIHGIMCC